MAICQTCGHELGWRLGWGIGICERCLEPVAASPEDPVPREMADDYRLFADLLSPIASAGRRALAVLPSELRSVPRGSLVEMALRTGAVCRPDPVHGIARRSFVGLDAERLASVISLGTSLLRTWPTGIQELTSRMLDDRRDDLEGYQKLRGEIRKLGNLRLQDVHQAALIRRALPDEFDSFARSNQAGGDYLLAAGVARRTGLTHVQLDAVRAELEDRRLPGRTRIRSQFGREKVEEFDRRNRAAEPFRTVASRLELPEYAVEQICCLGDLEIEVHPAVLLVKAAPCVSGDSLVALLDALRHRARTDLPPERAVSLAAASRRIGGRAKPWGAIVNALLSGETDFWIIGQEILTSTIHVARDALARFDAVDFDELRYPYFAFAGLVSQMEACELLNLSGWQHVPAVEAKNLPFEKRGKGMFVSKAEVLKLARRMVASSELGAVTGMPSKSASAWAARRGIPRVAGGWCRARLAGLGIIAIPQLDDA